MLPDSSFLLAVFNGHIGAWMDVTLLLNRTILDYFGLWNIGNSCHCSVHSPIPWLLFRCHCLGFSCTCKNLSRWDVIHLLMCTKALSQWLKMVQIFSTLSTLEFASSSQNWIELLTLLEQRTVASTCFSSSDVVTLTFCHMVPLYSVNIIPDNVFSLLCVQMVCFYIKVYLCIVVLCTQRITVWANILLFGPFWQCWSK